MTTSDWPIVPIHMNAPGDVSGGHRSYDNTRGFPANNAAITPQHTLVISAFQYS